MVRLEGFEPPTIRVEAGYSIQLSYSRMYLFILNPLYYPLNERQLVRLTGIEPVRPYGHQILSLRRLPISPQSRCLVSVGRIELPLHAPKARVIPFHYTELTWLRRQDSNLRSPAYETGGDDRTPLLRVKKVCQPVQLSSI